MGFFSADGNHKPTVLVADDEVAIADTLRAILNQNGFDVTVVYDGLAALNTACVLRPDILLSDVVMPSMNGIELAILISKRLPGCHVLLFSGNTGTADLNLEAHAHGYYFEILEKPVHPEELLKRLRALTAERSPEA